MVTLVITACDMVLNPATKYTSSTPESPLALNMAVGPITAGIPRPITDNSAKTMDWMKATFPEPEQ